MFSPETVSEIPAFVERKLAQWDRIKPTVEDGKLSGHPLELVRTGESKTQFMLTYNSEGFYESVIVGQLPQVHKVPVSKYKPGLFRDAKPEELPRFKQRIDLSDAEIDSVIALWAKGQSALPLAFVPSVWCRDGNEYLKK